MNPVELDRVTRTDHGRLRLTPTTLCVASGTITVLGGRNGSGKSTLLSLIAGELAPSTGSARLLGRDPAGRNATALAQERALLDQDAPAPPGFTVAEVVAWGRRCWRGTPEAAHDQAVVGQMIAEHGIAHLADRPVHELSGGERKRMHLARVRAQRSPVLLLDEADADLDLEGRYHLDQALRREADAGVAVVLVSHDLRRLARIADRLVMLDRGAVVADGAPSTIATPECLAVLFQIPPAAI